MVKLSGEAGPEVRETLSDDAAEILNMLEDLPSGITQSELVEIAQGADKDSHALVQAAHELIEKGLAAQQEEFGETIYIIKK